MAENATQDAALGRVDDAQREDSNITFDEPAKKGLQRSHFILKEDRKLPDGRIVPAAPRSIEAPASSAWLIAISYIH